MKSSTVATRKTAVKVAERSVAVLEFLKGFAVLAIGTGFAAMLRREGDVDDVALSLLYSLHMDHHRHISALFLRAADKVDDLNLLLLAFVAGVYCVLRFVEAYGLWCGRAWAEWFALISGAVYLPLEIYELARHATPVKAAIFVVNILVVAYMGWLRWKAHRGQSYETIAGPPISDAVNS